MKYKMRKLSADSILALGALFASGCSSDDSSSSHTNPDAAADTSVADAASSDSTGGGDALADGLIGDSAPTSDVSADRSDGSQLTTMTCGPQNTTCSAYLLSFPNDAGTYPFDPCCTATGVGGCGRITHGTVCVPLNFPGTTPSACPNIKKGGFVFQDMRGCCRKDGICGALDESGSGFGCVNLQDAYEVNGAPVPCNPDGGALPSDAATDSPSDAGGDARDD